MRTLFITMLACMVALVSACNREKSMTEQEKATVHALTTGLETRCMGRYLIDLPKNIRTFGDSVIERVRFEAIPASKAEFLQNISAREANLKSLVNLSGGYRVLYEHGVVPAIPDSYYFVSLDNPEGQSSDMPRIVEAYRWDRGYQIRLQSKAIDMVNSVYVRKTKGTPYDTGSELINDVPEKKRLVFGFLGRAEGRDETTIPTVPGVCFLGGFLHGRAGEREDLSGQYYLHDKQDVNFVLETTSFIREKTTLLQRGDSINDALKERNGHTVRKGVVDLPGMQAEEWLMAGTTYLYIPGHHFVLEANSKTGSALTPLLELDLDTGDTMPKDWQGDPPRKASLTENEAVALWDAVSRTLRPRPNGF